MGRRVHLLLLAVTVFVSAFLLFQVQPLIAKYILPWFGGSPAVWTTCMLFFQVALLAGYGYAHASVRWLSPRQQGVVHLAMLVVAAVMLPIVPAERWVPAGSADPTWAIVALLAASVGVPFFVLSSTGPLLQAWFVRVSERQPYRLYALSNAASLLALLSYPVVFEPHLTRAAQARLWSWGLLGYAVVCALVALGSVSSVVPLHPPPQRELEEKRKRHVALWLALSATASSLLLAVTNKICQDVAVVPLLWVVPLAIYLLSFIICFDSPRWYARPVFYAGAALSLAAACYVMFHGDDQLGIVAQITIYCTMLFMCCMFCHGELYRMRPSSQRLTSYYLTIAAGGAVGGALVAVAAPAMLSGYYELHLAMLAVGVLALIVVPRRRLLAGAGLAALAVALTIQATGVLQRSTLIERVRNFYGVLTVYEVERENPLQRHRVLQHGGVAHGLQFVHPSRRAIPTAYYGPRSGVGLALQHLPRNGPIRVGVVGLGIGTVVAYGQTGDIYRCYEINPAVIRLARDAFGFLANSPAKIEIAVGDARISLRDEPSQQFDLIILDAFSGDAIPVHLLTRECFALYQRHLRAGGVIAVHISNQYLDLAPVIQGQANHFGLGAVHILSEPQPLLGQYLARWMLLSSDRAWLESSPIREASSPAGGTPRDVPPWTDDHTSLVPILN